MELKLSEILHTLSFLAIFAFNIKGVSSTCLPPTESDLNDIDQVTQISTVQTEYVINDIVAFACDSGNGFGHFSIMCQSSEGSSIWGSRSRDCDRNIPFDYGSLAGILCGVFTLLVCIVLMILSTRLKMKRDREEAVELEIMQTADATKA